MVTRLVDTRRALEMTQIRPGTFPLVCARAEVVPKKEIVNGRCKNFFTMEQVRKIAAAKRTEGKKP